MRTARSRVEGIGRRAAHGARRDGVFGAMASHAAGGLGLRFTEALANSIETGRAEARFPVIETIVYANRLLGQRLGREAAAEVVRGEASGDCATSGAAGLDRSGIRRMVLARGRVTRSVRRWSALARAARARDRWHDAGPWAAVLILSAPAITLGRCLHFRPDLSRFQVDLEAEIHLVDIRRALIGSHADRARRRRADGGGEFRSTLASAT